MKRVLCLLLMAVMLLSFAACGAEQQNPQPNHAEAPADPLAAQYLADYALVTAHLPELPTMPSEEELMAAFEKIDYDKMGAEAYQQAQEKIWNDWDTRSRAYANAVREFRGEGVDVRFTDGFIDYTKDTALQLFKVHSGDNVIYSPANLYLALAMLSETVDGGSRTQLFDLLNLDSIEDARKCADSLWRNLYSETASGKCLLANSLWSNEQYQMKLDALKPLGETYHASVYRAPMGDKKTDAAIGEWVNGNTNGLLREAAQFETKPETLFMLLSTLYFKDQWSDDFNVGATSKDTFTNASGEKEEIDFMHKTDDHMGFFRDEENGYTVAQLYFKSGAAMRFLLPDEGVALQGLIENGAAIGGLQIYDMGVNIPVGEIHWSVPKFDVSSNLQLIEDLKALGVTDVFDDAKADFSPLVDLDEAAAVTSVQHAARVLVDENGCEAAAFTAITTDATAALPEELPQIEMNLNRPFTFMITGVDGLPLFVGVVNTL
ncbi:MAG: serpin family protein [Eubacteriales bacterium]|nr:serpin family protein [Eubacteriales bacterium]